MIPERPQLWEVRLPPLKSDSMIRVMLGLLGVKVVSLPRYRQFRSRSLPIARALLPRKRSLSAGPEA